MIEKIKERINDMSFEDAVYVSLREIEYSDRTARLAILAGRRAGADAERHDRALRNAAQRLKLLRSSAS
ncbi:MAG TPA: hypothetical protein VME92_05180 [Acetobacteraceae bacterium]|nr:hypothetical protein [Acetobacteraceae bacterium]